jgi:hypothetical protein
MEQAVKVGSQSVINVQMKDDSQMLAETVVIGYGSAKKRDLTGSITNIKGDEIANKPVVNPVSALPLEGEFFCPLKLPRYLEGLRCCSSL